MQVDVNITTTGGGDNTHGTNPRPSSTFTHAASAGKRAFLWNANTREACELLRTHNTPDQDQDQGKESQAQAHATAHDDSVKCLKLSACGKYLATGGDDKAVKLWRLGSGDEAYALVWSATLPKRVSALTISPKSDFVFAGDKWGEVWCVSVQNPKKVDDGKTKTVVATRVLGHFCSICTGLAVSPCSRYLATADRDMKIRVSVLPPSPCESGVHDIESYCLGHSVFVTCILFLGGLGGGQVLLASGAGDGQVKLWDAPKGEELSCVAVDSASSVASLAHCPPSATSSNSGLLVSLSESERVAIMRVEREGALVLLSAKITLDIGASNNLPKEICPVQLALDPNGSTLWATCYQKRASAQQEEEGQEGGKKGAVFACLYTLDLSGALNSGSNEEGEELALSWVEPSFCPWGKGRDAPLVLEDTSKVDKLRVVSPQLRKHIFPLDQREHRKRFRRDKV